MNTPKSPIPGNEEFSFSVGQLLRRGTTVFKIVEELGAFRVLEHSQTFERKFVELKDLQKDYLDQLLVPCEAHDIERMAKGDTFTEDDAPAFSFKLVAKSDASHAFAEQMTYYIKELRSRGHSSLRPTGLLQLEFDRLKKQLEDSKRFPNAPSIALSTVYKYSLEVDKHGGDFRYTYPKYEHRGGKGNPRITPLAARAATTVLDRVESNENERIRFHDIEKDMENELLKLVPFDRLYEELPSRSTIERITKERFSAYEICKRNKGEKFANKEFRSHYPRDRAQFTLEVLEFDDKDSRVFLIDELTGLPYGRGYVTSGVDQYSAVPLGFSISEKPRNTWSAMNAYANCVLPKDVSLPEFSLVESDIEFYGIMGMALFDNALYNHAKAFDTAIGETSNAMVAWAKPYTPTEKSCVEDFNGRMATEFFATLPGFGGEKGSRDHLNHGLATANMSLLEFKQGLMKWGFDVYCNTPRKGLTPRQRWQIGMANRKQRLPPNLHKFASAIALPGSVRFRPDGIMFNGLAYQNPRSILLRRFMGANAKVKFRYRPDSLSHIHVLDPTKDEYFVVPSVNPEYTKNLRLYQQELILKMAQSDGKKNPAIKDMLLHREKLKQLVLQLTFSPKRIERKRGAKIGPIESDTSNAGPTPESTYVTDLEYQVSEIDEVELDARDEGWSLAEDY